jgi:phage tail tape-measure protein
MGTNVKDKGPVAKVLDESIGDAELDNLLDKRHDEIESLLEEARAAKARGKFGPLEPLHDFLRRARERFRARR